ncbi:hypothetical protein [Burkholderia gladioli]|uniref:hypothetical protein n=1 Tax=Burkholderia gladioli TaxID=28095 RepID=UPI002FE2946A
MSTLLFRLLIVLVIVGAAILFYKGHVPLRVFIVALVGGVLVDYFGEEILSSSY